VVQLPRLRVAASFIIWSCAVLFASRFAAFEVNEVSLGERAVAVCEFRIEWGIGVASDFTEFKNFSLAHQCIQSSLKLINLKEKWMMGINQLRVADLVSSQQRKEKLSEKLLTLLGYHLQLNFLNSRSVPSSKD